MKIVTYNIKIMQNLRTVKNIIPLCIIIFLSVGCLRENQSGCNDEFLLRFHYITSNGQPLNSDIQEIDHLSVFVFDDNGIFIGEKKDSDLKINDNYSLRLSLPKGEYQFIVWAGLSDDYEITPCLPGQTHIEDFTLQLKRNEQNNIPTPPSLLYYGQQESVSLSPSATREITIGLQRITNTIRVIVHYTHVEIQPQISIEDNNGSYNHRGEIMSDQQIYYQPRYFQTTDLPNTWIADFNVMLLQSDSDARLKINSSDDEQQYNESLINGLLKANPDIDLTTDHDFTIEITFDNYYVPVNIQVNGWDIIFETVD